MLPDAKSFFCSEAGCPDDMPPKSPKDVRFFIKSRAFMLPFADDTEAGGGVPIGGVDRSIVTGDPILGLSGKGNAILPILGDGDPTCVDAGGAIPDGNICARYC
jgi:hypothetical protein